MKKKFTFLIAALMLLTMFASPIVMRADDAQYVFNTDAGIAALGIAKPSASAGTDLSATDPYVVGQISMSVTHGGTNTRVWNSGGTLDLRIYKSGGSLTFTAASGYNITGITIAGSAVNSLDVNVGTYSNGSWSNGTTGASSVTFTATDTGKINTITVTYTSTGSSLADSDLALTGAPVALSFDLYNNATPQEINYTTSSTGAITVSDSDYITTSVNTGTKKITVTPKAVTPSAQTITVTQAADNTYEAGSVTFTVSVANSAPTYTVTYKANGPDNTNDIVDNYHEGDNVTVRAANTFLYSGHAFTKWTTAANGTGNEYDPGDIISNITANIELYAQWEEVNEVVDELTVSWTGVTTNSYTAWSDKTITNGSDAVYAGKTNKSDNGIGFNNTGGDKGIITTTSGGYVRKVTVTWKTTSDRTLQVYGKNTPYSAVSDLYSSDSQVKGTLLGTIVYGKSTELSITGDYLYLGLRSASGYLSLEPIKITWEQDNAVATSVTIDASGINNNIFNNNTDGGSFSAIVKDNDNNTINNAPVTWSSSDATVATINETTGAVALVATGTTTIEASYAGVDDQYRPSSATYELTIINQDPNAPGTIGNPYTVAQARAAIDADEGLTDVYATGTVSEVIEYSSTYHNITYNISTDGLTTSDQLQAFRGKSYNGNNFTSENDIMVGDVVVVYGTLKKYGNTYEFDQNNQLVSLDRPTAEFTTAVSPANSGTVVAKDSEDQTVASGTQIENGTQLTVTATPAENYRFASWSVSGEGATIGNATENPTTFQIGLADATVTATFVPTFNVTTSVSPENTGTVTASPNPAIEGETVALTITPGTGYALQSLSVYKTGDQSTTVEVTNNQFEMPAYGVTVAATFSAEYTVTYKANGGTGDDIPVKYGAGANVTVAANTFEAPEGKLFSKWTTQADGQGEEYLPEATITNIQANINLFAQWRDIVYHITYNVNGETSGPVNVNYGESIDELPTPSLAPLTFLGWSTTGATGPVNVTAPYEPTGTTENITLYAVFGSTGTDDLEITGTTTGIPTGYGSETWTINSLNFYQSQIMQENESGTKVIQFKKSSAGYLYNESNFGKIKSIQITTVSGALTVKEGANEKPSSGTSIDPNFSDGVYTYTFSGNNNYFYIINATSYAIRAYSIVINYETAVPVTVITGEETLTSLPATPVVVANGGVLTFTGTNTDNTKLIIEDGGQLITNNSVKATVKKTITGHGAKATYDGWTFIASPVVVEGGVNPAAVSGMINATATKYDLYRFNDGVDKEWENYKNTEDHPNFTLVNGKGYLYANEDGTSLDFAGDVNPSTPDINVSLQYTEGQRFAGWNLVGNPFTADAYITNMSYYRMENDGKGNVVVNPSSSFSGAIKPCEGVMVKANEGGENVTFTTTEPEGSANNGNINIALAQIQATRGEKSLQTLDNAIVSFNEGSKLGKFYFGTQNANIYIPQEGEQYAIVSAEAQGEMPVCFKAAQDGQYTITVNPEEVEMGYLHLIDNIAGTDIDLLATPSYTFSAKADDYESRFRLVFSANSDINANLGDDFAFISNGQLIVTGEGTLQVVDMMGRVISTEIVKGTSSKAINAKAGVYVLQLIDGENVKTQKIVVR